MSAAQSPLWPLAMSILYKILYACDGDLVTSICQELFAAQLFSWAMFCAFHAAVSPSSTENALTEDSPPSWGPSKYLKFVLWGCI